MDDILLVGAKNGSLDLVQDALQGGANPNAKNQEGETALIMAASNGNAEIVKALLKAGCDPNIHADSKIDALQQAISWHHDDIMTMLLEAGADPNSIGNGGATPLMLAARTDDLARVDKLLDAGVYLDIQDDHGQTALIYASGNETIVRRLLEVGADPNLSNASYSPLKNASGKGRYGEVRDLLAAGANVDYQGYFKRTAIHSAASGKHQDVALLLLAGGANLSLEDGHGKTPKKIARGRTMTKLLKAGEDYRLNGRVEGLLPFGFKQAESDLQEAAAEIRQKREQIQLPSPKQLKPAAVVPEETSPLALHAAGRGDPKPILGENTRRLLEANGGPRAEHDALESLLTRVIQDKFLAELTYRKALGPEQAYLLNGAGARVEREYENGPNPSWQVDLWVGDEGKTLHRAMDTMARQLKEKLGDEGAVVQEDHKRITLDFNEKLDVLVDAFNSILSEPVAKIDMNELRAAAKAEAQSMRGSQQNLGR